MRSTGLRKFELGIMHKQIKIEITIFILCFNYFFVHMNSKYWQVYVVTKQTYVIMNIDDLELNKHRLAQGEVSNPLLLRCVKVDSLTKWALLLIRTKTCLKFKFFAEKMNKSPFSVVGVHVLFDMKHFLLMYHNWY